MIKVTKLSGKRRKYNLNGKKKKKSKKKKLRKTKSYK